MKLLSSLFLSIGLTLLPTLPISAAEDKGVEQVKQQKVNINKASVKLKNLLKRTDISLEQQSRLELINKIYKSNAK